MVIVPHPPYSPDLATCDFMLFPQLKMKLKGRRFETVSDIQRELQVILDSIKENGSTALLKRGKNMGSLHVFQRRLFCRKWQPKSSKLSPHFFPDLVWEISDSK
jgi:hypothetical protein